MSKSILMEGLDFIASEVPRIAKLAAEEERAAVVALLRAPIDGVIEEACLVAAAMIERGEHRREGDE